ncbi:hypothetical protein LAG90_07015 [Marinilongibacter aquaticus]|uniref:hypothetical protein n=1 Tax=Marinilongibacter aquaticus TaxID=2975157 RepID=UPI0021BD7CC7|nr:hypothetical protein [Marinilongibacter aquaticus]UBM60393.1 hypothetical protein LAG90_07015 [Marinilongibacter aquaticus]
MKKLILLFALCLPFCSFAFDDWQEENLAQEFAALSPLENQVIESGEDFETLAKLQPTLFENIALDLSTNIALTEADMPIVPPFWWGCVLGIVGFLVVYLVTDNDKEAVKSALIGCVISTLVFGSVFALTGLFTW